VNERLQVEHWNSLCGCSGFVAVRLCACAVGACMFIVMLPSMEVWRHREVKWSVVGKAIVWRSRPSAVETCTRTHGLSSGRSRKPLSLHVPTFDLPPFDPYQSVLASMEERASRLGGAPPKCEDRPTKHKRI